MSQSNDLIWKQVLSAIEPTMTPAVFKTWFRDCHLISVDGDIATLSVENEFAKNAIRKYSEDRILAHLSQALSRPILRANYMVQPTGTKKTKSETAQNQPTTQPKQPSQALFEQNQTPQAPSTLNPRYTFASFIVGNRNRLAYAAARAVAEQPGTAYNPLYLYGGVGLGKTHLMQAIGNEVIARNPQARVMYISCESFLNEFVSAVQKGRAESFKQKYRSVDVFLVDDIQFIAGKEGTQEEFFHTFNALYQTNKQIVMTSDKIPSDIGGLEERLASRFAAGMIADMQLPDQETRQAILQAKCLERGWDLSTDVVATIAEIVETNIRELEGALSTVHLQINGGVVPATAQGVRQALAGIVQTAPSARVSSCEELLSLVSEFYHISLEEIRGPRRQRELVLPRQVAMYLLKHELGMAYPRIGRELGGRDHTTAMHAVDKIEKELRKDAELLNQLASIKNLYYASLRSS